MSYAARAKPRGFDCREKLARAPQVLAAIAKKNGWVFHDSAQVCTLGIPIGERVVGASKGGVPMARFISFSKLVGEFTYDTDFQRDLEPALRKLVTADNKLSDQYEVADVGVANELAHGWKWDWVGEAEININNGEVFA